MKKSEVARNNCSKNSYANKFSKHEIINSQSQESTYYFDFIRNFQNLSPDSQKIKITELSGPFHESISDMKFTTFIEEELYDKKALSVKLLLAKDNQTNKTIGFVHCSAYRIYFLPYNLTLPNTYIFT